LGGVSRPTLLFGDSERKSLNGFTLAIKNGLALAKMDLPTFKTN